MSLPGLFCVDTSFHEFMKRVDHCCFQVDLQSMFCDSLEAGSDFAKTQIKETNMCNGKNNVNLHIKAKENSNAIKEVSETVNLLLSKKLSQDPIYFVFDEHVSNKNKENSNNNETDNERSVDLTSSVISDISMRKERTSSDSRSSNESQSIFGSPLKLQAIADLSAVGKDFKTSTPSVSKRNDFFKLQGLSITEARNVLRKFCQSNDSKTKRESLLKTIVVLCDGYDAKKTILMGANREESGGKTVMRTFCATLKNNQRVKLSSLQPINPDQATVEYHMSADYEMLDKRETAGFMLLHAQWHDQHGLPRISNLHSVKFSLQLSAIPGCSDSPMFPYCRQLEDVRLLYKALRNDDTSCIKKQNEFDAPNILQQLFKRIKKGEDSDLMSMNCDHGKKVNLSPERDSDFTDKVWNVIQHCTSYDDMVKCLSLTLKALKNREMSVYVHKDNQTFLAQLVRQSSLGFATFPPLSGGLPLKIIVEIGLEKIKRDYCAILIESGLISSYDLDNFLRECLKETNDEDVSTYNVEVVKEIVGKLHHCLELVCKMDTYSEHLDMKSVVSLVLNHYKTQKLNELQTFTLSIMPKQALSQIKNVSPCMIRRECETNGVTFVDCYLSDLPDSLAFLTCLPSDSCDASSSTLSESKEFYTFQTKVNTKILGPSS